MLMTYLISKLKIETRVKQMQKAIKKKLNCRKATI